MHSINGFIDFKEAKFKKEEIKDIACHLDHTSHDQSLRGWCRSAYFSLDPRKVHDAVEYSLKL